MPRHAERRAGAPRSRSMAPPPVMDLVTFYSQNLAVPARRDLDKPDVLAGKQLFYRYAAAFLPHAEIRHPPRHAQQGAGLPADLALFRLPAARHGAGLADGQPVGDATGNEWRTPPLWGIGLTQTGQRQHLLPA